MDLIGGLNVDHENKRAIDSTTQKRENNKEIWAVHEPPEKNKKRWMQRQIGGYYEELSQLSD